MSRSAELNEIHQLREENTRLKALLTVTVQEHLIFAHLSLLE